MAGPSPSSSAPKLVAPTPHRAYAFAGLFEGDTATAENAPLASSPAKWGQSLGALKRPASAPVPLSMERMCFERPSSPFRRVANPMVRDRHFVLGLKQGYVRKEGANP